MGPPSGERPSPGSSGPGPAGRLRALTVLVLMVLGATPETPARTFTEARASLRAALEAQDGPRAERVARELWGLDPLAGELLIAESLPTIPMLLQARLARILAERGRQVESYLSLLTAAAAAEPRGQLPLVEARQAMVKRLREDPDWGWQLGQRLPGIPRAQAALACQELGAVGGSAALELLAGLIGAERWELLGILLKQLPGRAQPDRGTLSELARVVSAPDPGLDLKQAVVRYLGRCGQAALPLLVDLFNATSVQAPDAELNTALHHQLVQLSGGVDYGTDPAQWQAYLVRQGQSPDALTSAGHPSAGRGQFWMAVTGFLLAFFALGAVWWWGATWPIYLALPLIPFLAVVSLLDLSGPESPQPRPGPGATEAGPLTQAACEAMAALLQQALEDGYGTAEVYPLPDRVLADGCRPEVRSGEALAPFGAVFHRARMMLVHPQEAGRAKAYLVLDEGALRADVRYLGSGSEVKIQDVQVEATVPMPPERLAVLTQPRVDPFPVPLEAPALGPSPLSDRTRVTRWWTRLGLSLLAHLFLGLAYLQLVSRHRVVAEVAAPEGVAQAASDWELYLAWLEAFRGGGQEGGEETNPFEQRPPKG